MKQQMKKFLTVIVLLMATVATAWAIDLKSAKTQGLIGERNDGYIGYVTSSPSAELTALVKDVNNKRKAKFTDSANKNNLTVEQVAQRFYERAVAATASGHYYQDASGNWVKK